MGEIVFHEKEKANFVYLTLKGEFELYKACKVLLNTKIKGFNEEKIGKRSNIYPTITK